MTNSAVVED